MKKIYYLMFAAVMIITACQPKPKTVLVDIGAARVSVSSLLDKYNSAFKIMDVNTIATLLADDALICGTDSSEFLDKNKLLGDWTKAASDTTLKMDYSIDRREIRVASDGNSAVVIEQLIMTWLSPKIPIRLIYHVVKTGDNWIIDFIGWNFIPENEDVAKLNKALE